jgi:RNA polymerase sigma-70 factor (ECF subfamily)
MFNSNKKAMTNFSEIYAKNYTEIVNYIVYKGLNTDTAQDIAQDVFIKALRLYESGAYNLEKSAVPTWLRTITNSAIIDFHRTNQYGKNCLHFTENANDDESEEIYVQFVDNSAKADSRINRKELRAKINKAFATLNDKEQVIAYLYFKRECEYNEIEKHTGFPMGTIKGMINRIREKMQVELGNVRIA